MNNRFSELKDIFVEGNIFDYVNLDKSVIAYNKVVKAIQKPLKLILLYGKPGCGKSFLLKKIQLDLKDKHKIILFPQPYFDEIEFLKALYKQIFNESSNEFTGYESFLEIYKQKKDEKQEAIIVLLDEAQLYPASLMEKIRLMADTREFKFLFTVHKTEQEDMLARDYFKTRIWESIELLNSTYIEISTYLEQKFLFHDLREYLNMFKKKHIKMLYKLSNGNLRTLNKLMYKIFEIYEYLEANQPSLISGKTLDEKYVKMAAIDVGLLDA